MFLASHKILSLQNTYLQGIKKKNVSENGYNSECSFSYLVEIRRSLFTIPAVKIPDTLKQVKS